MAKAKIAVTIDEEVVGRIDKLVKQKAFVNRSQAIEAAVRDTLARMDRSRLARESAKLDPSGEREIADEGLLEDARLWPRS
jgi:Arc/MetJ-type ribon-helix-helix transcriptional regulator